MGGSPSDRFLALRAAILLLLRTAPSGRLALARLQEALDPAWMRGPELERLRREVELAAAAARAQALEGRAVTRALRSAWGTPPEDVLEDLETAPVAVTAAAQVHRATHEGRAVAVKLLRPGLARAVRQDLALLDALARPLAGALPGLDARAVLGEIRQRIAEELDLEHEAGMARRVHRLLREHPRLFAPAPVVELCTEEVLVAEWVEGRPLIGADVPALLELVAGLLSAGLAYADPVPANLLVRGDGRLAVVDLGGLRVVEPARATLYAAVAQALVDRDAGAFGRALAALEILGEQDGPAALALALDVLGPLAGPSRLDVPAVVGLGERAEDHAAAAARLAGATGGRPEDLWPGRGLLLALGSVARLGAEGDWPAAVRDALAAGLTR